MPRVSVILTVYNAAPFVGAAIDSVLGQTFADFELIIVNDGSTDESAAVLDRYQGRDPRVRIIHQLNEGPSGSLNAGLRLAGAEYVALLDGDDCFHPDKLADHVSLMDHTLQTDLTFSWSDWIDRTGTLTGLGSRRVRGAFSFTDLLEDFAIGNTSSVVFRRSCLDSIGLCDPLFFRYYDVDLFLRIALLRPNNVLALPRPLTLYRRHEGQMSRDWRSMEAEWKQLLAKLCALAPNSVSANRRGCSNMSRYFAFLAYESGHYSSAARQLKASLLNSPSLFLTDLRNWKVSAAVAAAMLLPRSVHRRLELLAGIRGAGSHASAESSPRVT